MRVMTWNIRTGIGNDPDQPGGRTAPDLDRVARVIASIRPDVVALQEVDRHRDRTGYVDQPQILARLTGMAVVFDPNLVDATGEYGVAILTPHPIVSSEHVLLPSVDGWEPRGLLDVVVRIGERPIRVLNTHLQVGGAGRDDEARVQREDSASALALRVRRSDVPVVLMGDLNADPSSPEMWPLGFLTDAWSEKGEGKGATIPASPFEEPRERIDAILVDGGVLVPECAVIRTAETQLASDHYPVVADLALVPR